MVKYDDELKLKVINAYLRGEGGYITLAKQFNIGHRSTVQRWVRTYKKIGIDSICRKKKGLAAFS
ncbi:helix-turn-helix domain-containing protein [Clostridium sp. HBUAS56017]|uniref:helix-turn-helix domain-containing protein n=1 Tax=Clostridium sp. HBUAS56017 TaxID=2571128 RepID=UPI0011789E19|nr:helix-turn-helix domain-containing protein [Clostridium sp. HBUAS56017]